MNSEEPGSASTDPLLQLSDDGVAWLVLDQPGTGVNLLTSEAIQRLDQRLDEVHDRIDEGHVRALIVTSRKPGCFVAGTDLSEVGRPRDAAEATARALEAQRVLRRLEQLPVPTVAAINGLCLGSGLELALACAYRIASDATATRLGLPEVQVGIIPGLGATVRLPRLIGLQPSLELVLSGDAVDPRDALRLGLVDQVVPAGELEERATEFALQRFEQGRLPKRARRRVPRRLLEDTAPGRRLVIARSAQRLLARHRYADPAPQRALEAVTDGVTLPLESAFARAAEIVGELLVTDRARGLVHAFRVTRGARRAQPAPRRRVEHVAVLGAGEPGSELAALLAMADIPVRLKDRSRDALVAGLRRVLARLAVEVERGTLDEEVAERRAHYVSGGIGFGGFGTVDLVAAAVGDRTEALERALLEAEEHTREDSILAVVGPMPPVGRLQQVLSRPEQVIGLHLIPPVDRFALVELTTGPRTSAEAVAACRALTLRLGGVPLMSSEAEGPLGSRLLGLWLAEAIRLLDEGASILQVDRVMEEFGMALGPFRRADAIGVRRTVDLLERLAQRFGEHLRPAGVVRRLTRDEATFYRYRGHQPVGPSPDLPVGIPDGSTGLDEVIRNRLLLVLLNEAALAVEQGVARAVDVDMASLAGLGFPRWRGGLIYHAEQLGLTRLLHTLHEYAGRFGSRFAPALLLQRAADGSGTLYDGPAPPTGHVAQRVL